MKYKGALNQTPWVRILKNYAASFDGYHLEIKISYRNNFKDDNSFFLGSIRTMALKFRQQLIPNAHTVLWLDKSMFSPYQGWFSQSSTFVPLHLSLHQS
jgi:hypothetical protein